jgi:hypothetical protein
MKTVVVYASKYGSTKGMAEFIAEKLRQQGTQADAKKSARSTTSKTTMPSSLEVPSTGPLAEGGSGVCDAKSRRVGQSFGVAVY